VSDPEGTWGVYVHVPWCRRRCPYCAFYVEVDRDVPWDAFIDRVLGEYAWRRRSFPGQPRSVFLGGGTPSRMPPHALARLVRGLNAYPDAEVTAEANPEDATDAWLENAMAAGINRISLGLQTFNPRFARLLNRMSTVQQAHQTALRIAAAGLRSWSVDVVFALPEQRVEDLVVDVEAILQVGPPHVSLYGLTFEPGTPFERALQRGKLAPVDDEVWRAMYLRLVRELEGAGLRRYEVSNFARPGHESVHNLLYWTDRPYLGLGPSAHGYAPDGTRWGNVRDANRYLEQEDPTATSEVPTPEQQALDLLVSVMRGRLGLDLDHLARHTGHSLPDAVVDDLVTRSLLVREGRRIALSEAGFPVADAVIRHLAGRLVRTVAEAPRAD